jgi:dCMP deaminase
MRALSVLDMQKAVAGLGVFKDVRVFDAEATSILDCDTVVMPEDEISTVLTETYFKERSVVRENIFLRWDKPITLAEGVVSPDRIVSDDDTDRAYMELAEKEAERSADWWRQVGAVAVRDGAVLCRGFNAHHPSEYAVFAVGNPRDNFDAGEHLEISPTLHGEASIVAQCARTGTSLNGASVYVTTFPCINCARLLAEAGVLKVYYRDGYSRLDAEAVLKDHNVEIILVRDSRPQ